MSLAAQIIDQQVSGVVERHSDAFTEELRLGVDEHRRRSISFLFFVAKTAFELTDEQALDGFVGGGNDFGIDALYFEPPDDGEIHVTLVQGKYKPNLDGASAFPENSIEKVIGAIGALFDPALPVQLNRRLNERVEEVRSFVKDGAIPRLAGNRVSEAVTATLSARDQRPNFYFYNNGVTITCSQFSHNALQNRDWVVRVSDLQIVNGGQTARTVQQVAREVGAEIGEAEVLVRIYELPQKDAELVEATTFATNSQNPVDLRDLKANDPRQKALGQSISALGYAYRAKREERQVLPHEFTSAVIAEAVLAIWRDRPHQARFRGREHFGALCREIFTDDLNGAQAIIAAQLHRHAENHRKRPPEDAPDFLSLRVPLHGHADGTLSARRDGHCTQSARPSPFRRRAGPGGTEVGGLPHQGANADRRCARSVVHGKGADAATPVGDLRRADLVDTLLEAAP